MAEAIEIEEWERKKKPKKEFAKEALSIWRCLLPYLEVEQLTLFQGVAAKFYNELIP